MFHNFPLDLTGKHGTSPMTLQDNYAKAKAPHVGHKYDLVMKSISGLRKSLSMLLCSLFWSRPARFHKSPSHAKRRVEKLRLSTIYGLRAAAKFIMQGSPTCKPFWTFSFFIVSLCPVVQLPLLGLWPRLMHANLKEASKVQKACLDKEDTPLWPACR